MDEYMDDEGYITEEGLKNIQEYMELTKATIAYQDTDRIDELDGNDDKYMCMWMDGNKTIN